MLRNDTVILWQFERCYLYLWTLDVELAAAMQKMKVKEQKGSGE